MDSPFPAALLFSVPILKREISVLYCSNKHFYMYINEYKNFFLHSTRHILCTIY